MIGGQAAARLLCAGPSRIRFSRPGLGKPMPVASRWRGSGRQRPATPLRRTTRRRYDAQRLRAGILGGQARAVPAARIERPWSDLRAGEGAGGGGGSRGGGKGGGAPALPTCYSLLRPDRVRRPLDECLDALDVVARELAREVGHAACRG